MARVESKTFIVTKEKHDTIPRSEAGAKGGMGLWMPPEEMRKEMDERFKDCMAGMLYYCRICWSSLRLHLFLLLLCLLLFFVFSFFSSKLLLKCVAIVKRFV